MAVSQSTFVEAFYTTPLFKLERILLAWFARKPASDAHARQLASGLRETFDAWRMVKQDEEQLLLADLTGRTKSWLMSEAIATTAANTGARLYFGSAVLPVRRTDRGTDRGTDAGLGIAFHALLGFHRLYSRLLLRAAGSRAQMLRHAAAI